MSGKNLVIVESPGKVKTIQKYLGKDFLVKASIGHIRDLEEHNLGVDVENGFKPEYVIPADKKKVVADLRKLADSASTIWLASDEDREGEAISWHLAQTLELPKDKTRRIVFHEITQPAILEAIEHPRDIDMNLVYAQQARRVLDRLVGFELSPILWKKIQPKLSAGRVQSVALRLIVDREKEIMAFKPEPFYRVEAEFRPVGSKIGLKATLDTKFPSQAQARAFLEESIGANYRIASIDKKDGERYPAPPFTTSTLQQEAGRKLRFSVASTMRVAQTLYERGLITYMRTDSTNLSSLALGAAKKYILDCYGQDYLNIRQYHTKSKGAQEAHEAIRPTYIGSPRIDGTPQEKALYELIWKRTIASQMAASKVLNTSITIEQDRRPELYGLQSTELLFDGFMKVYMEGRDDDSQDDVEIMLPSLNAGDPLTEHGVYALSKFTAPPQRYSEVTLVKKLEELGIGRPSTYAATVDTLTRGRGYAVKGDKPGTVYEVKNLTLKGSVIKESVKKEVVGAEKGKLLPQEIGLIVTDFLVDNFADVLDYDFTATVEEDFDKIADGKKDWSSTIGSFYRPFHNNVEKVLQEKGYSRVTRELGLAPDGQMVTATFGKFGAYVQKGEGENRQSASLGKDQLIETITLSDALKLLELPRTVGKIMGLDVIATRGKFGPYLKYGVRNVKLPRGKDPLTITLEECEALINETPAEKPAQEIIAEFGDIKIINGRYGPYIKQGESNYKIPRGKDAASLTEADCQAIISENGPTKKFVRRGNKSK
ncbi:MAG: type I DNA topoisomerase [Bacteroidales bacterium]|nr:type I DNA topoisomerase [Bacteroidales bacterium]